MSEVYNLGVGYPISSLQHAPDGSCLAPCHQDVAVEGNSFTLNGKPWIPRAVGLRAFEAPTSYSKTNAPTEYNATLAYGPAELKAIHAYGADTIRFLISQPALDPKSPQYNPAYKEQLVNAVKLARSHHFVVELAMQDETHSGSKIFYPLASHSTLRAWDSLNTVFGKDKGVMFELYNEPNLKPTASNWQLWAHGGQVPAVGHAPAFDAVGMQQMIDHLRKSGSQNTFVLDGLDLGKSLNGLPPIHDPLQRVGYAVHPYFDGHVESTEEMNRRFGDISKRVPVFADEWSATSGVRKHGLGLDGLSSYEPAVNLLNYLRKRHIGLGFGGFDAPGFVNQQGPGGPYTNYDNYNAQERGDNAGTLVHNLFMSDYKCQLNAWDGLSPNGLAEEILRILEDLVG